MCFLIPRKAVPLRRNTRAKITSHKIRQPDCAVAGKTAKSFLRLEVTLAKEKTQSRNEETTMQCAVEQERRTEHTDRVHRYISFSFRWCTFHAREDGRSWFTLQHSTLLSRELSFTFFFSRTRPPPPPLYCLAPQRPRISIQKLKKKKKIRAINHSI